MLKFSIENKNVVLIDDVLFTGRSIKAAMSSIDSYGRPNSIELLVLIDRRYRREIPIQANYCGAKIDTFKGDKVNVVWNENSKKDVIYIDQSDINYFILNWNFIKSKLFEKFPKILETIDNLHFLTDHEKKYALMKHFRLDVDLLADKLNVSKRTIETNLYRVNNKLKKNNINPDILLKNS